MLASVLASLAVAALPQRADNAPKVGDAAPIFAATSIENRSVFDLGKTSLSKPLVLIFGSCT